MAHPDWCGKDCNVCENNCALDENIACSPGCSGLDSITGKPNAPYCKTCDSYIMNHLEK